MSDTNELSSIMEKAEKIVEQAQELVLVPELHTTDVKICGKSVSLRPLPISYAKKWSKKFRDVLKLSTSPDEVERRKWVEDADELICDAMCECVVMLKDYYEIPAISMEKIQETMTINDVKTVVKAQAKLNEDDDFLLMPLRNILSMLSRVSPTGNPQMTEEQDLSA